MRFRTQLTAAALTVLAACSSDAVAPAPSYENISGTYSGTLAGTAQGVTLNGTFALAITQDAGELLGTASTNGTLNDGTSTVVVGGTSSFVGTIGAGLNPSISITGASASCPSQSSTFTGTLDSANNLITLSGPINILDTDCSIFLTYNSVILLSR